MKDARGQPDDHPLGHRASVGSIYRRQESVRTPEMLPETNPNPQSLILYEVYLNGVFS